MRSVLSEAGHVPVASMAWWLALAITLWYLQSAFRAWYPMRHIPGPWLASFSYLWLALPIFGKGDEWYLSLKRYGSLVRNGPGYLVTDDPEILRKITSARSKYSRHEWWNGLRFHPDRDSLVSYTENARHDEMKAKTAAGYNDRDNFDIEAAIDEQVSRLIHLLRRKYVSTSGSLRALDFSYLSRFFALDLGSRVTYGMALGHLDEGTDVIKYVSQQDRLMWIMAMAADLPLARNIIFSPFVLRRLGPMPTDTWGIGRVMGIIDDVVRDRFHNKEQLQNDMMGTFIRHGLTRSECQSEGMLVILAGAEAAATLIRGIMMLLIGTPRVYSEFKAEIKDSVNRGIASSPIKSVEARKLPYLQAIVQEGIRMRTPLVASHYKKVPPEGDILNGVFVPGGTGIGHNLVALTHNEKVWGQDTQIFRPERFLEGSEEKRNEMRRVVDLFFGSGRWQCAGKPIAMMELQKIFFELFRTFDFQHIHPDHPWKQQTYITQHHTDQWLRVTEAAW